MDNATLQPGQDVLHYRIGDKIGEGGMGEVWRATDTELGRDVAIKVLPAILANDGERLARFQREARLLASLNHPHIATIHGLHEAETDEHTIRFLVMELVVSNERSRSRSRLRVHSGGLLVRHPRGSGALALPVQKLHCARDQRSWRDPGG